MSEVVCRDNLEVCYFSVGSTDLFGYFLGDSSLALKKLNIASLCDLCLSSNSKTPFTLNFPPFKGNSITLC
jgi:hypothetical protein